MDVRIEELPDIKVLCVRKTGPYGQSAGAAFEQLFGWIGAHQMMDKVEGVYGYGLDNPHVVPENMLRYVACAAVAGAPEGNPDEGVEASTLPGGRYAIHRMKGSCKQMPTRFRQLADEWLPASGEVPDFTRPFIEIYLNDICEVGEDGALTDLCVPIRERVTA